jgi:hypothetical protein
LNRSVICNNQLSGILSSVKHSVCCLLIPSPAIRLPQGAPHQQGSG